jgi:hypothetical protein
MLLQIQRLEALARTLELSQIDGCVDESRGFMAEDVVVQPAVYDFQVLRQMVIGCVPVITTLRRLAHL